MNTEQAKKLSENALNRLMEALEKGQSEALKNYLSVMSRFHNYSWGNCLMIYSQRSNATHVAGFYGWLKLRRYVRKREKGIVILAPMVGRKQTTNGDLAEDEETRVFGFRAAHVFDVSQTEGEPLPEFATINGNPSGYTEKLQAFVASRAIELEYSEGIAPAKGLSSGGKIVLLPDLSPAEHFAVLAHEAAHELLHKSQRRAKTTPTVRETEAEAVAFVVSTAIGLDIGSASSDYIQMYDGDEETLAESLTLVQQTASDILRAVMPERPEG
jgi:hypothetical protein